MLKILKNISAILAFAALFFALAVITFAEGEAAENTESPLFSLTYADGEVAYYYEEMDLVYSAPVIPDGTTDFHVEEGLEETKTIYFDFNGFYVNQQRKHRQGNMEEQMNNFMFLCGNNTTLYIYSSKPGAAFYGKDLINTDRPHRCPNFASTVHDTANLYIGDFGEYSGDNLSVYTAVVAKAQGGMIYINGGNYYRLKGDSRSQFILTASNGEVPTERSGMEIKDALIVCLSGNPFTFTCATRDDEKKFSIDVDNCIISGKAGIVHELPFGYNLNITNSYVMTNNLTANHTDSTQSGFVSPFGNVNIDYGCFFAERVSNIPEYVNFPEEYELASVDKVQNTTFTYPDWGDTHASINYNPVPHDAVINGQFTLAHPDDVVSVTWVCDNNTRVERRVKGDLPSIPFNSIADSNAVEYYVEGYAPLTEDVRWEIKCKKKFEIYVNLTVYSSINVNFYVPTSAFSDIKEVNFTGVSEFDPTKAKICQIDGEDYYKISTSGLRLSNCIKDYSYMFVAKDGLGNERVINGKVSLTGYMKQILDGEYDAATKALITKTVGRIINAYNELEITIPAGFSALTQPVAFNYEFWDLKRFCA